MAYERAADTWDLIADLERLLVEERELSAVRRRLHDQLDKGLPSEVTALRERRISDQRLALHRRIDEIRALLANLPRDPQITLAERATLAQLGL
jgi:hypothetical protein